MIEVLDCEGAPRDLGLDQGRWCRKSLQAEFLTLPVWQRWASKLGRGSYPQRQLARDLRRYFPQQAEALEGMARGAEVPRAWLVEQLRVAGRSGAGPELAFGLAASADLVAGGSVLGRALPQGGIARRSRPDGGFASIELTEPWRTAPLAGINEGGLAVVVLAGARASRASVCAAPASLLAQDCLHRFQGLDAAVDWCLARPSGARAQILLADASGEVAQVTIDGAARSVARPADGLLIELGGARRDDVAKALREAAPLVAEDLGRFLGLELVTLDVGRRRLGLLRGSTERWLEIAA